MKKLIFIFNLFGVNLKKYFSFWFGLPSYILSYFKIKKALKKNDDFKIVIPYPVLDEKKQEGGNARGHYFHQDLYVAKQILKQNPEKHVDIGSRIDGFVAHVAVFRKIELFDIRNLDANIPNIKFQQADLMGLPENLINYTDSISSLHVIEHFGLGRYGDEFDLNGHLKAIENIYKILKTGGIFYFSAPIGKQRIEFNAHRVFDVSYLLKIFEEYFELARFSYINDKGDFFENQEITEGNLNNNFGCKFGCGIFELIKK